MRNELLQNPVFAMAVEQFDIVADFLNLSADIRAHQVAQAADNGDRADPAR